MRPAVVFDCDGVLVESEELAWSAWRSVLARHGVDVQPADIRTLTGRGQQDVHAAFAARAPLPAAERLLNEVQDATLAAIGRGLVAYPDAVETVAELRARGILLAVASSSPRRRLAASLAATNLTGAFAASVAGDEVQAGKPAPDLFLTAAERLGADPRGCVAVEDSPAGVVAARAAGMSVAAVARPHLERSLLASADVVLDRLSADALLELLSAT